MNIDIPNAPRVRDSIAAAGLLALVFIALAAGFWIGSSQTPKPEAMTAAPEVRQGDGSVILARAPNAKPPVAPHKIPPGTVEVRRVTTKIAPAQENCDPITITSSLIQDGDGLRAVVSADNGTIVEGTDTPIRALNLAPAPRLWAVEALYDPFNKHYGARVSRDVGRLRLSVNAIQRDKDRLDHFVGVGFNF
ncbi:MAG: hypothetical protein V4607_02140 [Pseudomonadota bacterium]